MLTFVKNILTTSILFLQEFADGLIQFFAYNFVFCPAGNFLGVTAGNFANVTLVDSRWSLVSSENMIKLCRAGNME
jgi:hypothetical protein